jgi:hypothetical protein
VRRGPSEEEKAARTEHTEGGGWQRCFTRFWRDDGSPTTGDGRDAKGEHGGGAQLFGGGE